jgi:hypothetical protein
VERRKFRKHSQKTQGVPVMWLSLWKNQQRSLEMMKELKDNSEYSIARETLVKGGEYCGIYTGSYNVSNISYRNLSPLTFSFIS